jgi:predicted GTPase
LSGYRQQVGSSEDIDRRQDGSPARWFHIKEAITKQLNSQAPDDVIRGMIQEELIAQRNKPFVVSIMGQTGVGKTSLINALFNTKLRVDAVRPTTKEIERVTIKNAKGHMIITLCTEAKQDAKG